MNFTQINVFINVAETLNFSETAQKMHMTQPSITKNIQQLELELTKKLFNRNKGIVSLTAEGEFFYHNISDIMLRIEQTVTQVKQQDFFDNITLGYTNTPFEKMFLPKLLKRMATDLDNVNLALHNFNLNSSVDALLSKRFDLLLTTDDNVGINKNIAFEPILESNFKVLLPVTDRLAKRSVLTIDDLINSDIIYFNPRQSPPAIDQVQMTLKDLGPKRKFNVAETANTLVTMVKGQQGIGILPGFVIDQNDLEIASVPLESEVKITYGLAYLKSDDRLFLHDLIHLMKEVILNEHD
ncbi:hth-type transcriptional regulator alsr (als operon regulatoryprotein) [Weissella koreensis KACC 15510]|uniref:LysR family transcriptional regulator n=1 Tax=Weissella koreensis TaxID=165096 RepID=UPI0002175BE7|nr:LysR family transcriptional regulator [Weissella koreensis]AEJ23622.1 hth-type transcriptional regulator alsr (als operon regulatoryprotein) [Weissella koreensis KACC 15510]